MKNIINEQSYIFDTDQFVNEMSKLLITIFLLISLQTLGQFDYELFEQIR
jgi:hypothetical protein